MPIQRRIDTKPSQDDPPASCPAGFTLIELLVASTLGLMAMAAVATLFGTFGRTVSQSQAVIDLDARIRNATWRLRQDLHGMTAPSKTWLRPEANAGYFEIVESGTMPAGPALVGDRDDRLALTTVSLANAFTGRLQGTAGFESSTAEVVWFCEQSSQTFEGQLLFNLYRRQLLVSATPGAGSFSAGVAATIDRNLSDLSCRNVGTGQVANSLADLTKAAHRFWAVAGATKTLQGDRQGEDIILSNVVAFDIRILSAGGSATNDQPFNTNYEDGGTPSGGQAPSGIEVRIRCIEPSSRRVRQVTVVHAFEGQ